MKKKDVFRNDARLDAAGAAFLAGAVSLAVLFTVAMPDEVEELSLNPPAITRLAEVQVPTLLIVGDYDIPDKLALTQKLAAEIPNARQVIIPGVAHMVSMEKPEEFNRVVLDFLSQVTNE